MFRFYLVTLYCNNHEFSQDYFMDNRYYFIIDNAANFVF